LKTLYPKKVFTFLETKPEEKVYEVRIHLKNVREALAKVTKIMADANVSIETGALFYPTKDHQTGFWTLFIETSNSTKNLKMLESELKSLDVVLDVAVEEPKPLAFDVMHFPLLHGNSRAIILPIGVFRALWEGFETILLPSGLEAVLYAAGKKVGEKVTITLKEKYGVPETELVNAILQACQATGWGIPSIKDIDYQKNEATLIVRECFEALSWKRKPYKTCHWTRGYFAGMMGVIFNELIEATETKCASMGDEYCMFKLKKKQN
jgi:predicted hydrocarbon binding protein